jgi:protoporphyrinogen oxidase
MKPTVIIGAGLTGLSTGYALQKSGLPVVILERASRVGGLARSVDRGGYIFDLGPHYFFLKFDPRADLLAKECLEDKADVFDFQVSSIIRGRNIAWPPNFKDFFRLPISTSFTFVKNALRRKFPEDKDCEGFMSRFFGPAIYKEFIGPYLDKKVPGLGAKGLHRDWWLQVSRNYDNQFKGAGQDEMKDIEAQKKPSFMTRLKTLNNILMGIVATARGNQKRQVLYPHGGMGSLSEALAEKFREAGGKIVFEAEGVKLQRSNSRIKTVSWDQEEIHDPRHVVWTGSVHEICKQFDLPVPNFPFIQILLVFVKVKRTLDLPPFLYTYYAAPDIVFNRAYFPRLITQGLVPEGKDAICLEISLPLPDRDQPVDEAAFRESTLEGLEKVGLCRREEIEDLSFMRVPDAYPAYPLDYYDSLQKVWETLGAVENLWSVGRSGQYYYNNMARSISLGLDLAEHLIDLKQPAEA